MKSWVTIGLPKELKEKAKKLPGPDWYKFIYLHLGGLPFTYRMRSWGRHNPLPTILATALLLWLDWRWFGGIGFLLTGILLGHIWWGAKRTK